MCQRTLTLRALAFSVFIGSVALIGGATPCMAGGPPELSLGTTSLSGFAPGLLDLRMDVPEDAAGFTVSVTYDAAQIAVIGVTAAGVAAGADLVVGEIFPGVAGLTLHVTMDTDGSGPATIPAGTDLLIGQIQIVAMDVAMVGSDVEFVDDVFGTPLVRNTVELTTGPVSVAEGLTLIGGQVLGLPPGPDRLIVEETEIESLDTAAVRVLMDNPAGRVEGFAVAIAHDDSVLQLEEINLDGTVTDLVGAEFVQVDVSPVGGSGGTLAVFLDFQAPLDGQTIASGAGQHIANFVYTVLTDLQADVDTEQTYPLQLVDNVLGDPLVENLLLIFGVGQVVNPELVSGAVIATPIPALLDSLVEFYVGGPELELGPDGIPTTPAPTALRGDTTELCFYYTSEVNLQGFQLAVCFDCELKLSNFRVDDTILDEVGVEFVNYQIDQQPFDGDGCELIVGILLDALPPFDGQTVPPTATPLKIGCVDATVCDEPICKPQPDLDDDGVVLYCGPEGLTLSPSGEPVNGFLQGDPGETIDVCFYYTSEFAEIQGFQLAICYDCSLSIGGLSIQDTVVESVGAEFVNYNIDTDPDDGDGCEMVAGILLDVFPPFDGQTLPPTSVPLKIASFPVTISPDAQCEELLTIEFCDFIDGAGDVMIENIAVIDFTSGQNLPKYCCAVRVGGPEPCVCLPIDFCNFINGVGSVSIENIAVVDFTSYQALNFYPGEVCLDRKTRFIRGDCNQDEKVDLADAATTLGAEFSDLDPECDDACDANDDGSVNLADVVFLLNYLLDLSAPPFAPFPECGFDPTDEDFLDCEAFDDCN